MTTHRAPFNIINSPLGTETTVVSIDASGRIVADVSANFSHVSAGTGNFGGVQAAASAITFNADTTVQGTARSSADALIGVTVNGTVMYIPAYSSAAF